MKIINSSDNILDFLEFVSSKKKEHTDWQFLHLSIQSSDVGLKIDEVIQFLEFQVQSKQGYLLQMTGSNEFLLFTHKEDSLVLSKFEKSVYENFPSDALRCVLKSMNDDNLIQFSDIIKPHIPHNNLKAVISFKRMSRVGNCIMVLDDDPMVLKQLEKVLGGFGTVILVQNPDEFSERYQEYAPDLLFLDIHLRTAKGNEILKVLKTDIDPKAHVVMISSDTQKTMILDIKQSGANGFVVKPFDRNKLYKEIMRAPTIVTKAS